jgi:hypothetical protein
MKLALEGGELIVWEVGAGAELDHGHERAAGVRLRVGVGVARVEILVERQVRFPYVQGVHGLGEHPSLVWVLVVAALQVAVQDRSRRAGDRRPRLQVRVLYEGHGVLLFGCGGTWVWGRPGRAAPCCRMVLSFSGGIGGEGRCGLCGSRQRPRWR